jgi:hypothetical protein
MSTQKIYDQWTKFLLEYEQYFKLNAQKTEYDENHICITSKSKITSNYKR